jgi:methionyl aminopeptidase
MIQLKSPREIDVMAEGGRILGQTLRTLAEQVRPGITTLELDLIAEKFILNHPGATPAFKGLYGFPATVCVSVNEEIVHGIPSGRRVLREGDIVSLDVGVKFGDLYTDSAITVPVGAVDEESQRLMDTAKQALAAGIAAARAGNHVGDIGHAIHEVVAAAGLVTADDLVGHYVGYAPHGDPQVPNVGKRHRGVRLAPGLTIAIEPMVNLGTSRTRTLTDKWTVVTGDGRRSAHFEHTVAVTDEGPRVLTAA